MFTATLKVSPTSLAIYIAGVMKRVVFVEAARAVKLP
jgi:hypothetical protein